MTTIVINNNGTWQKFEDANAVLNDMRVSARWVAQAVRDGVWTTEDLEPYGLRIAVPFELPENHKLVGEARFEEIDDEVYEIWDTQELRASGPWQISTYTVVRRVIAAGKAADADALLNAYPDLKFRFLTVGHVLSNDAPMNDALRALGLDPAIILAPEE